MTFLELYGDTLDQELGTADRTQRFTTVRRKAAINTAQREFVRLTECLQRIATIAVVDEQQEYELEASISDFGWLSKRGVEIKIVDASSNVRYLAGDDLAITTVETLNREEPNWRAATAGTPLEQYVDEDGGSVNLGFHPAPDVGTSETWTIYVPYIAKPTDMSADADEPFTVSSNVKKRLWPWHPALAHYAAGLLERLRKNTDGEAKQMKLFSGYVADYLQQQRPKGGQRVQLTHTYRRQSRHRGPNPDRDWV